MRYIILLMISVLLLTSCSVQAPEPKPNVYSDAIRDTKQIQKQAETDKQAAEEIMGE